MTAALLVVGALILAFSNGANDNFKGFATVWGAQALSFRKALLAATAATLAGSLASLTLAGGLVARFSGEGLVAENIAASPPFVAAVGLGAAGTVALATRLGMPISTSHALIGALVGAGLASGGVDLGQLRLCFLAPMLVSPFMAAAAGGVVFYMIRARRRASAPPFLGAHARPAVEGAHFLSAAAICFSRGVNDTPKMAALLVAADAFGARLAAAAVAVGMTVGGLLFARRVAETMSLKINQMDAPQGVCANLIAAGLVLGASRFGLPVSTTHVMVGSIAGVGGPAGTLRLATLSAVVLAWVFTLPAAAALAWTAAQLSR
jgi:PiT family inorganic phosphate transporter